MCIRDSVSTAETHSSSAVQLPKIPSAFSCFRCPCLLYTSAGYADYKGNIVLFDADGNIILTENYVHTKPSDAVSYTHLDVYKRQRYGEIERVRLLP